MEQSYVAFFDILGFKDLVSNNSHENLVEIYNTVFYETLNMNEPIMKMIYKAIPLLGTKDLETIQTYIISDSIIFIQPVSKKGLLYLLAMSRIFSSSCIAEGVPLRGGISVGNVTVLNEGYGTTVIGDGLVKAHEIEGNQSWAGIVVDEECFKILNDDPETAGMVKALCENYSAPLIKKYNAVTKKGIIESYVVDWTKYDLIKSEDDVLNSFSQHNKSIDNPRVKEIISNSLEFYKYAKGLNK
ncbi:hypothetical protein [Flavobacterium caeni]|uniref:Guanylate cyclase domain-containing protein n=1 Tax=Flavobacterium caeni TaxID=490189 RepID=A0A1G5KMW8_9FLAO|nr:hypothetical protein [Flavobacterium caeni]SCZ01430.1 hypothetical protein SAMN02927903_03368 [Flavobacterium caeni]